MMHTEYQVTCSQCGKKLELNDPKYACDGVEECIVHTVRNTTLRLRKGINIILDCSVRGVWTTDSIE